MDYQDLEKAAAMFERIALTEAEKYLVDYLKANLSDIYESYIQALEDRWIDRHSVNCYFCGKMFDERESCGTTDGGDVCPECYKGQNNRELVEVE